MSKYRDLMSMITYRDMKTDTNIDPFGEAYERYFESLDNWSIELWEAEMLIKSFSNKGGFPYMMSNTRDTLLIYIERNENDVEYLFSKMLVDVEGYPEFIEVFRYLYSHFPKKRDFFVSEIRKMDYVRKIHLRKMFDFHKYTSEMDAVYCVLVDDTKIELTYSYHDDPFFTDLYLDDTERETFNMYQAYRITTSYGEVTLYEDRTRERICEEIGYRGTTYKNILGDINGTHYVMLDLGSYYVVEVDRLAYTKTTWLNVGTNLNELLFEKSTIVGICEGDCDKQDK